MAKIDAITIPVRFEVEWLEDLIRRLIREELDARQGEEDAEALQAVERELGKPRRVSGTRCGPEDPRVAFRKDGALAWNDYTHEKLGRPESVHVDRGERILQIFPSSGSRSSLSRPKSGGAVGKAGTCTLRESSIYPRMTGDSNLRRWSPTRAGFKA